MATKNQQQEDMMNAFVSSIPSIQTDVALLKQDMGVVKKNGQTVLDRLDKLSVISKAEFEEYKKEDREEKEKIDLRIKALETYQNENAPGTKLSNAIVNRWMTFLVLLLLTAAVIALVGRFLPVGSIGV